jgi:hypothetical protein
MHDLCRRKNADSLGCVGYDKLNYLFLTHNYAACCERRDPIRSGMREQDLERWISNKNVLPVYAMKQKATKKKNNVSL